MNKRDWFVVALEEATTPNILDLVSTGCWPAKGLLFETVNPSGGRCELMVRAEDMLGCADLAAATIKKPLCLPFDLVEVAPGRINADLRNDMNSRVLAARILRLLPDIYLVPKKASGVRVEPQRRE